MTEQKPLDPHYDPSKVRPKKGTKIKKMIAVVSGKGGVGKSTISALLASHAQRVGYQSAMIDGDIVGPSLGQLFNIHESAVADENGIIPFISPSGLKIFSSNMMVETETTPILWRGPLISGAIKQFYTDVLWGEIDLMVLDMPPGTGDIALTVFQSLPIDGIIIVTTPQDLVSMIVSKAIEMAVQMDIPILGIIENYSYLICDDCGHKMYPFGESKLEALAMHYDLPIIAQLPLDPTYASLADQGKIETIESEQFAWLVETLMK